MNRQLGYFCAKLIGKLKRDKQKETLNRWFVKSGVHLELSGDGWININSNIALNEPHLIYIGQNTTIAGNVNLITHDNSISKVIDQTTDLFGKIVIGRNCFIGASSVIMYGVTIADNVIVAAGSVVTKSIHESNVIVAGNPARTISSWDRFREKSKDFAWNLNDENQSNWKYETGKGIKCVTR